VVAWKRRLTLSRVVSRSARHATISISLDTHPPRPFGLGDGIGLGLGDGIGFGLGDGIGFGFGDGIGFGFGDGIGFGFGDGIGFGDGDGIGFGLGSGPGSARGQHRLELPSERRVLRHLLAPLTG